MEEKVCSNVPMENNLAQEPQEQPPVEEIRAANSTIINTLSPNEDHIHGSTFDDASSSNEITDISCNCNNDTYNNPLLQSMLRRDGKEGEQESYGNLHHATEAGTLRDYWQVPTTVVGGPTQSDLEQNAMLHQENGIQDEFFVPHGSNITGIDQQSSINDQSLPSTFGPQGISNNTMLRRERLTLEEGEEPQPYYHHQKSINKIYVAMITLLFIFSSALFVGYGNRPAINRFDQAWSCGIQITNNAHQESLISPLYYNVHGGNDNNQEPSLASILPPLDEARERAVTWFVSGAGRNIKIGDNCASKESLFSILYSLLVIRESIGITDISWYKNEPIEKLSDVCKWSRVHCNNIGGIIINTNNDDADDDEEKLVIEKLIFNNANLIGGTIPPEMMRLTDLTSLDLYTNRQLNGSIPSSIFKLINLEYLFVQDSGLSGLIPSEIGQLLRLRQFHFDNTHFVGTMPESICKLTEKGSEGRLDSVRGTCGTRLFETCSCCKHCKQPISSGATNHQSIVISKLVDK